VLLVNFVDDPSLDQLARIIHAVERLEFRSEAVHPFRRHPFSENNAFAWDNPLARYKATMAIFAHPRTRGRFVKRSF